MTEYNFKTTFWLCTELVYGMNSEVDFFSFAVRKIKPLLLNLIRVMRMWGLNYISWIRARLEHAACMHA